MNPRLPILPCHRFGSSAPRLSGLAVLLALSALPATAQNFRLQLLHASDLEGGVEAIQDAPNFAAIVDKLETLEPNTLILSAGDNYIPGPFFSAASDPAARGALRTVNDAAFGLAAGSLSDLREGLGRVDVTIMNIIGFHASALGNHEFDAGTGVIREMIGTDIRGAALGQVRWLGTQFPYLGANLDFSGDVSLSGIHTAEIRPHTEFRSLPADLTAAGAAKKIAPATTVLIGGERIGVVGATTPLLERISSPGTTRVRQPGAGTNDMTALAGILQPVVNALRDSGVNKIILVSHLQQVQLEQDLIGRLSGVDIVVAGGSDTLFANPANPLRAGDTAAGAYPFATTNLDGDPALVVSTDGQYSYVGRLVVEFDAQGKIVPTSVDPLVSGPYKTDEAGVAAVWGADNAFAAGGRGALVRQLTDAVLGVVIAKDANVVGRTAVYLEGRRTAVRTEETSLGNLSADANLFVARQHDPTTLVSIKNGGGIRAEIGEVDGITGELRPTRANPLSGKEAGEISQLDIENALRFNNLLSLQTLSATQLVAVLEHGVAASAPGATPGQFPQVGGVRFSHDFTRPAGSRVRNAVLFDPEGRLVDVLVRNGAVAGPPDRPIRVVTLNFMADGGDGYPFKTFADANATFANRVDLAGVLTDPGAATFAAPGSEQDALAEYLAARFVATPFNEPDTTAAGDLRAQNLAERPDAAGPRLLSSILGGGFLTVRFETVLGRDHVFRTTPDIGQAFTAPAQTPATGNGLPSEIQVPYQATGNLFFEMSYDAE